ncbi:hypothetical protein CLU79DRAFT_861583, partial [Phycomyces nitens]
LIPNGHSNILFGNPLRTDGFSLDFLFYIRRQIGYGSFNQSLELRLDDFTMSEIDEMYTPTSIDPGRKSVFTVAVDVLFRFYNQDTTKDRFNLYQGSQRGPEQLVNILTHGTVKYSRSRQDKNTRRQIKRIEKKNKKKESQSATTGKNKSKKWKSLPFSQDKKKGSIGRVWCWYVQQEHCEVQGTLKWRCRVILQNIQET